MRHTWFLLTLSLISAAERKVDPTFLYRSIAGVKPVAAALGNSSSRYRPLFGAGEAPSPVVRGVARFGELTVDPGGSSNSVRNPAEEQAWVILAGSGTISYRGEKVPVRKNDFFYIPPE